MKLKISILGSTGSIGRSALSIVDKERKKISINILSANRNYDLIKKQIRDENIKNFIKILKTHLFTNKELSVFSGKIGAFNKKTCINLT